VRSFKVRINTDNDLSLDLLSPSPTLDSVQLLLELLGADEGGGELGLDLLLLGEPGLEDGLGEGVFGDSLAQLLLSELLFLTLELKSLLLERLPQRFELLALQVEVEVDGWLQSSLMQRFRVGAALVIMSHFGRRGALGHRVVLCLVFVLRVLSPLHLYQLRPLFLLLSTFPSRSHGRVRVPL